MTGLAGTSSVGGYTFAEVGGALKVTRSDGVDFEILAGVKTGSGGDAASDAVARVQTVPLWLVKILRLI